MTSERLLPGDFLPVRHDPACPGVWMVRRVDPAALVDADGWADCSLCGGRVLLILIDGFPPIIAGGYP